MHGKTAGQSANRQEKKEKEPTVKNNKKKIRKHETSPSDS
jgi:hypothetical protein